MRKLYKDINTWEGLYQMAPDGFIIDLRTHREIEPGKKRRHILTDNSGKSFTYTVDELFELRTKRQAIGQSNAKSGTSNLPAALESFRAAYQEKCKELAQCKSELFALRKYIKG